MIAIILACISLASVQEAYYGPHSARIAFLSADDICERGVERDIALNRISRANYKIAEYRRALRIARTIDTRHHKLYYDTIQLKALLYQNLGRFAKSDSLYQVLVTAALPYDDLNYRIYINLAEFNRLMRDYGARETNLLLALSYAEGQERNKVIRVLARHYFNVLLDFDSAQKMIEQHPTDSLTTENKAGLALLKAQYSEARGVYDRAVKYYLQADTLAKRAGFVSFQYEASDGVMRASVLNSRAVAERVQWQAFKYGFLGLISLLYLLNYFYERRTRDQR